MKWLEALLGALRQTELVAHPKKCQLVLEDAENLGYTIGCGMVKPRKRKIQSITNWPHPATKRQERTFLGLVDYYCQLIPHFAAVAVPLHDLTLNWLPQHLKWTEDAETAFVTLREALCSEP